MTILILIVVTAIDPARLVPWLLLAYYAPGRVFAAVGGVIAGAAAWGLVRTLTVLPPSDVDYFTLAAGCALGALVPMLLWGPFQRIRAARRK